MWKIAKITTKISKVTLKPIVIGGAHMTWIRLLPFIPPVSIGIHILFSSFWPKRILFFSGGQRREFLGGQKYHWFKALVLLGLALATNTYLVDTLQSTFNETLPLLTVYVRRKAGWRVAMLASICSMAACVSYIISFSILAWKTSIDHENLTNEEIEWTEMLKQKKKVTYKTALGQKVEWANQIKYKKERIGGWTWVLPILLCFIGCGLAYAGASNPKVAIATEPKGAFGRAIESVLTKVGLYEKEMKITKQNSDMDCVPFASLHDVFEVFLDERKNLLRDQYNKFFNKTEALIAPLKNLVQNVTSQFMRDTGEAVLGEDIVGAIENFKDLDLRHLPWIWILVIPKALQLFTLVFGMLTMSCVASDWLCNMTIYIEPEKIVDFFGTMCKFSFFYCIISQIALFNTLSSFSIPFYKIYIEYGLGFSYDIASEVVMWSIWIGMKNEFFFAIPKRRTTVSYSVPGVSDTGTGGPQNQII